MASIHKDPRRKSPFWYCAYRLPSGKRVFRSTKLKNKTEAEKFCDKLAYASDEARKGRLIDTRARELISQIVQDATGAPVRDYTVREWFKAWLRTKEQVSAGNTLSIYQHIAKSFLSSLGDRADLWLHQINFEDILAYRDSIVEAGRTARTANHAVTIISSVFNQALRQHYIQANPCTALGRLKEEKRERDVFTPEQIAKLVEAAEGDWKTVVLFAYYTGARLTDITNMPWSVVNWKDKTLSFTPQKTGKPITIPIHPQLERELCKNAGIGKARMFPELAGLRTSGKHGLSGQFKNIMEKAAVTGKTTTGSGARSFSSLSFHSLRHSFTSAMAAAGVSPEVRMKLTGHSDNNVHAGYTHHELETLRGAVALIPNIK